MKRTYKINKDFKVEKEEKVGLYLTIIVHLLILIVFLLYSIRTQIAKETSFVLDFTRQEELEKQVREQELIKSVNEELDALLKAGRGQKVRNVVVDANEKTLRDDRNNRNADALDENRRLQERLNENRRRVQEASDSEEDVSIGKKGKEEKRKKETYRGPSVISYTLDGRKALSLPIPAYKCQAGGDVSVSIIVNAKGYVIGTKVIEAVSSQDRCLREYALKAAGRSRFNAVNSKEKQVGEIVYRFVEQ